MTMGGFTPDKPRQVDFPSHAPSMPNQPPGAPADQQKALDELAALAQQGGSPKDFWPRFMDATLALAQADQLVLLVKKAEQGWRRLL